MSETTIAPSAEALLGQIDADLKQAMRDRDEVAKAADRGYTCLIVQDATESYFPAFKRATLETIVAQGGIVGWCAPSAAVLAALAPA